MTAAQLVTCETVAAVVLHARRVADIPVRLSGHSPLRPLALCGRPVDWDTEIPVSVRAVTCRNCRAELELGIAKAPGVDQVAETAAAASKLCERCGVRPAIPRRPGPARCSECADQPASRRRDRRRARPRSRTIGRAALRREVRLHALDPAAPLVERPRTRGDCRGAERPCPWVGCRHHIYLDINPESGSIKINFPEIEPWELQHSCSLDVAELGGLPLNGVGPILNLTRGRIQQLEVRGLLKLKRGSPSADEIGADMVRPALASEDTR